eukprot:342872_1
MGASDGLPRVPRVIFQAHINAFTVSPLSDKSKLKIDAPGLTFKIVPAGVGFRVEYENSQDAVIDVRVTVDGKLVEKGNFCLSPSAPKLPNILASLAEVSRSNTSSNKISQTVQRSVPTAMRNGVPTASRTSLPTASRTSLPTASRIALPAAKRSAVPTARRSAVPTAMRSVDFTPSSAQMPVKPTKVPSSNSISDSSKCSMPTARRSVFIGKRSLQTDKPSVPTARRSVPTALRVNLADKMPKPSNIPGKDGDSTICNVFNTIPTANRSSKPVATARRTNVPRPAIPTATRRSVPTARRSALPAKRLVVEAAHPAEKTPADLCIPSSEHSVPQSSVTESNSTTVNPGAVGNSRQSAVKTSAKRVSSAEHTKSSQVGPSSTVNELSVPTAKRSSRSGSVPGGSASSFNAQIVRSAASVPVVDTETPAGNCILNPDTQPVTEAKAVQNDTRVSDNVSGTAPARAFPTVAKKSTCRPQAKRSESSCVDPKLAAPCSLPLPVDKSSAPLPVRKRPEPPKARKKLVLQSQTVSQSQGVSTAQHVNPQRTGAGPCLTNGSGSRKRPVGAKARKKVKKKRRRLNDLSADVPVPCGSASPGGSSLSGSSMSLPAAPQTVWLLSEKAAEVLAEEVLHELRSAFRLPLWVSQRAFIASQSVDQRAQLEKLPFDQETEIIRVMQTRFPRCSPLFFALRDVFGREISFVENLWTKVDQRRVSIMSTFPAKPAVTMKENSLDSAAPLVREMLSVTTDPALSASERLRALSAIGKRLFERNEANCQELKRLQSGAPRDKKQFGRVTKYEKSSDVLQNNHHASSCRANGIQFSGKLEASSSSQSNDVQMEIVDTGLIEGIEISMQPTESEQSHLEDPRSSRKSSNISTNSASAQINGM